MNAKGRKFATSFHTYHPKFIGAREVDRAGRATARLRASSRRPSFSMVQASSAFRTSATTSTTGTCGKLVELADRRGLLYQFNEFRGTHMGKALQPRSQVPRSTARARGSTSTPRARIYNCQYHLTERKNAFGNITEHRCECRPLPKPWASSSPATTSATATRVTRTPATVRSATAHGKVFRRTRRRRAHLPASGWSPPRFTPGREALLHPGRPRRSRSTRCSPRSGKRRSDEPTADRSDEAVTRGPTSASRSTRPNKKKQSARRAVARRSRAA